MLPTGYGSSAKVSAFILVFLILVSFFWIIGYSFNFSFLRCKGKRSSRVGSDDGSSESGGSNNGDSCGRSQQADAGKAFVFALIISLIILLIIWAFMAARKC
jgi:hypothetical protein